MKTKVASLGRRNSIWAVASLAALLVAGAPAFAQHGGGHGGGGGGGGGGGHASGGGGGHGGGFGGGHAGGYGGARAGSFGGGGYRGSGFGGPYSAARGGFSGGHAIAGTQYAPRSAYSGLRGGYSGARASASVNVYHNSYVGRAGYTGRAAYVGHPAYGYGYGHGGFGWHRPYWGGGYWRGGYWPRCYYGWSYPWFIGALPGVYATYWWGGLPYYYANNVYYTWNPGYNGYVVTDPPPADGQETASSAPADGTYDSAEPGSTSGGGSVSSSGSAEVYAYPKSGQSDEQQATDRYECHKWAVAQSGYDPTRGSQASGSSADYRRAMVACLDGRGYSTK